MCFVVPPQTHARVLPHSVRLQSACWFHCRVEFGSIMLWYYLADRTTTFPRGIKARLPQ